MTSLAASAADRALLRRFEPVIRYTAGEKFFPMDVEAYVRACSLWVQHGPNNPICLIPEGELTLEKLAEPRAHGFGSVYFLRFIEPINISDLASYALQETLARRNPKEKFHAGPGRLARVGYSSRLVDALFSLTLLARGRVPGDAALAAGQTYRQMLAEADTHCYYGRVVRQGGWVALQYWFFYPFNNWRSGFSGVNDHEADWEMIYIYLAETEAGEVEPAWVAYASHDFSGDDLRRRWDDPELVRVGDHPVIYAGAGSHASYYVRGEYLTEIELPLLTPLIQTIERLQTTWRTALGWAKGEAAEALHVFRVPFVDYARGEGLVIGPGGDKEWAEPRLLNPAPDWATQYRGLWGLYARDPIAGENAPAGPMYNRDGTVRRAWYDPLGWAGLDKELPPTQIPQRLEERRRELQAHRAELQQQIDALSHRLTDLGVEAAAMVGRPHLSQAYAAHQAEMETLSKELAHLRAQVAADDLLSEALDSHAAGLRAGVRPGFGGPVRAHIQRAHRPASDEGLRLSRFAELWAAVSIGLMMVAFVGLVIFARHYLVYGLTALLALLIFVEAGFRRRLPQLIVSVTNALALVGALVLLFEFFWEIVIGGVLVAGAYIMWENLRELRD